MHTFCWLKKHVQYILVQESESFCQHDLKNWCAPVQLCESPALRMSGWTVQLTNVWLSWWFYLSGSQPLHVYFYHNLPRAFGVMSEKPHHLCLSRAHIHCMTCINHEMLCMRHFVDLILFSQSGPATLCYHDALLLFLCLLSESFLHMEKILLSI